MKFWFIIVFIEFILFWFIIFNFYLLIFRIMVFFLYIFKFIFRVEWKCLFLVKKWMIIYRFIKVGFVVVFSLCKLIFWGIMDMCWLLVSLVFWVLMWSLKLWWCWNCFRMVIIWCIWFFCLIFLIWVMKWIFFLIWFCIKLMAIVWWRKV